MTVIHPPAQVGRTELGGKTARILALFGALKGVEMG